MGTVSTRGGHSPSKLRRFASSFRPLMREPGGRSLNKARNCTPSWCSFTSFVHWPTVKLRPAKVGRRLKMRGHHFANSTFPASLSDADRVGHFSNTMSAPTRAHQPPGYCVNSVTRKWDHVPADMPASGQCRVRGGRSKHMSHEVTHNSSEKHSGVFYSAAVTAPCNRRLTLGTSLRSLKVGFPSAWYTQAPSGRVTVPQKLRPLAAHKTTPYRRPC